MPLRFRRSVKIAPGMRLNFSGSGTSLSVGGRGATVNFSKRGTRATLGIPGTGLSYSASSRRPSQRAIERQYEREDRERLRAEALSRVRVSVDDEGVLTCSDAHGSPLRGRDLTLLWEKERSSITTLLLSAADEINGDIELLDNIHLDAPFPSPHNLIEPIPFLEPEPSVPKTINYPNEPKFLEPDAPRFVSRLFGGKRRHAKRTIQAKEIFDSRHEAWISRCRDIDTQNAQQKTNWQQSADDWTVKREQHALENQKREQDHVEKLRTDTGYADVTVQSTMSALEWPRETLISHRLDAVAETVWIDVDFPEIEDLPQRLAALAASGKKLNVKAKPQKTLRMEYARHIHGVALRIAASAAAALPWAQNIFVSGYSQRLNSATGVIQDDYLLSVFFTRSGLEKIDFGALNQVDPIDAVAAFEHRRKMTATGIFKPVEPYSPDGS